MRFFTGSLAYLTIFAIFIYLFAFRWVRRHEGLILGFFVMLLGLLLEWHAILFMTRPMRDKEVFGATAQLLASDIIHFKVQHFMGGGMLGALVYKPSAFLFSNIGSFLFGALLILLGAFLMSPWNVYDVIDFCKGKKVQLTDRYEQYKQKQFVKKEARKAKLEQEKFKAEQQALDEAVFDNGGLLVDQETGEIIDPSQEMSPQIAKEPEIISYEPLVDYDGIEGNDGPATQADPQLYGEPMSDDNLIGEEVAVSSEKPPIDFQHYQLPSIDLFAPDKPKNQSKEKNIVRKNISVLEQTFESFGIDVKVERAEIGPSVTKYEVKPAVGVRVNRISNLADDLALALAAKDVRIEAPIPGKSLVGIEVPNSEIATVSFRELWEQSQTDPNKLLEVPLGKAVNGSARSFDLARMPHLLVAGSTGSGKSVAVNGIISSILMKARPDQVKFLMVDPKMVELSVYNDIPHLLIPVVTNPRKASKALQKVVNEMENRYELFSHFGVRNIASYNAKVEEFNAQSEQKHIPLPLIVVIVDDICHGSILQWLHIAYSYRL
ncbi:MAG: DNA translocase FtsK, partial [Enterococcus sp.]|nr:DNA translocase FtsK [Enterococcus sp.]